VLSAKNVAALEAAHKHLTSVIDGAKDQASSASKTANKELLRMGDITKQELVDSIAASSVEAVRQILKDQRKAKKVEAEAKATAAADAADTAEKTTGGTQSNNAGEVSESDIKPTKETDSDDINAVKEDETDEVTKSEAEPDAFTKQVETQLESLTKGLAAVEQLVTKIAKRPRPGGPSLDGQDRGISPAVEGRQGDATKSEGDEIEALQKSLDEAKEPAQKQAIGYRLAHARLMKAHETGQL
jgi:hypothetical protein